MATTRTRKQATKKTTPRNTTKPAHNPARDRATIVDLRKPLPPRPRHLTGPMGPNEQAAIRAALATAATRLPIPVRTWNGSTANLTDGTILTHNPGPDRVFTAHIACPHGAIHGWPITTHTDLREARALTRICTRPHGTHDADTAITHGVRPTPAPKPSAVLQLREGIHRAHAATADTQPLNTQDIADGLNARAADTAKEPTRA